MLRHATYAGNLSKLAERARYVGSQPSLTGKVLNLHRLNTNNVGDLRCAPHLYFPELLGSDAREILGFRSADAPIREERVAFNTAFSDADTIVVGGGGLLEIDFFQPFFTYLADKKRTDQKVILWGAGHNDWVLGDWRNLKAHYTFDASLFDLIGTRDADEQYRWVPCVSCMSPALDTPRPIKREIGVYAHVGTINNEEFRKKLPTGFEMIDNTSSFEDAVEFLGTSELVLTDSFHGAYWATMMGRKVVAFPSSSKFYSLKHTVPLCAPEDWKRFSRLAQVYSGALVG
jgi:hypothetical protein